MSREGNQSNAHERIWREIGMRQTASMLVSVLALPPWLIRHDMTHTDIKNERDNSMRTEKGIDFKERVYMHIGNSSYIHGKV
jgi:hypothetical protein